MKNPNPSRTAIYLATLVGSFLFSSAFLQAQGDPTQVQAKVSDVSVIMQKTPEFQAQVSDNKKDGKKREWLEVEVEFETRSDSKIGIIPEMMITYYVAVKGTTPMVLTDSFTYTNVIDDEDQFAVVYVSPSGLARINGEMDKFKLGDVAAWGVELLYKGRVVATDASSGGEWWTSTQATRMPGLLTVKEKTPFGLLWIDRHLQAADR